MTLRVGDSAAVSDTGRVRRSNEDAFHACAPLFAVADGMGGAQAGDVASRIAADALDRGLDESLAPEQRLVKVVREANSEIHQRSLSDAAMAGMGTTMTAVLVGDDEVTVAHVGDSRAYRVRDGELTRLTCDHSLVGEMVRRGALSEEEAESHPQRSILTRALGPEPEVDVDVHTHGARDGDLYLICSDGLTGMVDETTIQAAAAAGTGMRQIADDLVRRANENGGVDNITVIAFTLIATGAAPQVLSKAASEPTSSGEPGSQTEVDMAPVEPLEPKPEPTTVAKPAATAAGGAAGAQAHREPRPAAPPSAPPATNVREQAFARNRRSRKALTIGMVSLVLVLAITGAVVGSLQVYFIGVDDHGLLTVYRGVPYSLPLELNLYTTDYVSTKPANQLSPAEQARLLDHRMRSRSDALDLIQRVQQGQVTIDDTQ